MKPRRENGATFVSPMTSAVSCGSALMMDFLRLVTICIQQTIAAERKSPACEDPADISDRCVGVLGKFDAQKNKAVGAI
jgi:hypothetical protein